MRYLIGLVLALALVASPLGVSAREGGDAAEPRAVATQPAEEAQPAQSWLERMHPEALEAPAKTPEPAFEIEYVPAQAEPQSEEGRGQGMSKGGKIAIAVFIPLVVAGVALGVAAGAVMSSWDD